MYAKWCTRLRKHLGMSSTPVTAVQITVHFTHVYVSENDIESSARQHD